MIIVRAPLPGDDARYVYAIIKKRFDGKLRVSDGETEIVDHIEYLQHLMARACLRRVGISRGVEIILLSDSEEGSRGAARTALLHALSLYRLEETGSELLFHRPNTL